jgi:CheY-like chemotaxis protein
MPKRHAVSLVDGLAEDAAVAADAAHDDALRAQAAFIRTLADEAERMHPSDSRIAAVHAQLGDELDRLAELVKSRTQQREHDVAEPPIDVLLVEDDEEARDVIGHVLVGLGYPCRAVATAEEAQVELTREPAALVLADWNLPGASGLELCHWLKQHHPHTYVILASAYAEEVRRLDGLHGGADDFIVKPTDVHDLERRLEAASRLIRAIQGVARLRQRLG